jgi:imidazolonepropionase-like amidohydrolase
VQLIATVETWPKLTVETAPDYVKNHKKDGADYIKLMQEDCCSLAMPTGSIPSASLEFQTAVVNAAHAEGMIAVGHATSINNTTIILKAGGDGMTHTFVDQTPTKEIIDLYKQKGAFVIPTLVVHASLTGEEQARREKFAKLGADKGILNDFFYQTKTEFLGMKSEEAKLEHAYESIRQLKAAGIDVVCGTDAVAGLKGTALGVSMWMEMEMYIQECGFSVVEALTSATSTGARRFHFDDRGVVQEGKRADLVLVEGDLTSKLDTLWGGNGGKGIVTVWKEGIPMA